MEKSELDKVIGTQEDFPKLMKELETVPAHIYYEKARQEFRDSRDNSVMDLMFYNKWVGRRDEFPECFAEIDPKDEN